jgi:hypothetical protein
MKFRLIYEGEIAPRQAAKLSDIHAIRQALHPQIKRLWDHEPLASRNWLREKDPKASDGDVYARIKPIGGTRYAPLIATDLAAELDIVFLRQQAKGQLIGEGGDIDNRLKTLFDALRTPSKSEVQQLGTAVSNDADPLHCLLQDDALIHRVNIETDRLLKQADAKTLIAIIQVSVLVTKMTYGTLGLGGY